MSLINIQEEETSAQLLGSKAKRSRSDFYNPKKVYLNIVTNGLKVEALTTEYTSTPAHMYKSITQIAKFPAKLFSLLGFCIIQPPIWSRLLPIMDNVPISSTY
jgi:hypothetical protein